MTGNEPHDSEDRAEPQIEALFSSDEATSIVDSLLALPDDVAPEAGGNSLDRAVFNRLQTRLAARMRRVIEADEDEGRQSAA